MPILMNVDELEPGMTLAQDIYNDITMLLPQGSPLTPENINHLLTKLPHIQVRVEYPRLDKVVDFQDVNSDHKVAQEITSTAVRAINRVNAKLKSGLTLDDQQTMCFTRTINEVLDQLNRNPPSSALIKHSDSCQYNMPEHTGNVFFLSLMIGFTMRHFMRSERERLSALKVIWQGADPRPLAAAAMFHDIGMAPIEHLVSKQGDLTEEEMESVKQHPQKALEMLPETVQPIVRQSIRMHHENMNGTGYPDGLSGESINVHARIIRIADAYTAATAGGPNRKAKSPIEAFYEMVYGRYRHFFDPAIIKMFALVIQPIPIGARLKLLWGKTALVVRHNRRNPFDPQVIIAFDERDKPLPENSLESPFYLHERPNIKLLEFGDEDISYLNNLPGAGSAKLPAEAETNPGNECFSLLYP